MYPHKPLPATPKPTPTTLTVDARLHLQNLTRQALVKDAHSSVLAGSMEKWVQAFESAMDQVGDCAARGDWLGGTKRKRVQRTGRAAEGKSKEEQGELSQDSLRSSRTSGPRSNGRHSIEDNDTTSRSQDTVAAALTQIRRLISLPSARAPIAQSSPAHLLLCVAPPENIISTDIDDDDSGGVSCVFTPGIFSCPDLGSAPEFASDIILYGLDEWDTSSQQDEVVRLIGGTFSFQGVESPLEHSMLFKALRIVVYVHLSMLLEQHFLADSHVRLEFPKPKTPPVSPVTGKPPSIDRRPSVPEVKSRSRKPIFPSGILSFFSKRSLVHRIATVGSPVRRGGSLDLEPIILPSNGQVRSSEDSAAVRPRKFSFITGPSFLKPAVSEIVELPMTIALARVEESRKLLSTSPCVSLSPPSLLATLAQKEKKDPGRRLKGDEKTGLTSILGWDGKKTKGRGMSGILGFIRMQQFSVLYSRHVPCPPPPPTPNPTSSSISASSDELNSAHFSPCDQARWITYHYYSCEQGSGDRSLGETIVDLASRAEEACDAPDCQFKRGEHQLRFIHGGLRIVADIESTIGKRDPSGDGINVWESCAVCNSVTTHNRMSDGTYLFSFAKYLELLIYSPVVCTLTPSLCAHTTPLTVSTDLPESRLNIVRHFSYRQHIITFSLSLVADIFELRVPRLQITRSDASKPTRSSMSADAAESALDHKGDEDKKELRREIMKWWQGVAEHMDRLEEIFNTDNLESFKKALPRLPSADENYDEFHKVSELPQTASESSLPPLPSSVPGSPLSHDKTSSYFSVPESSIAASASSSSLTPMPAKPSDPVYLLSNLRHTFQRTEQSLYALLSITSPASLNDVRRSFLTAARGASRRLTAWQNKHISATNKVGQLSLQEPEWWRLGCHAIPGGNVIVREDDWGSIIAFTLGTADYQRELANLSYARPASAVPPPSLTPSPSVSHPSAFTRGFRLFTTSAHTQPDPDQEDVVWHEPEPYSAVISRKDHPRDATYLLSLREVLRQKSPTDGSSSLMSTRFTNSGNSRAAPAMPPAAWAKPEVQVSTQAAGGEVAGLPAEGESAGAILHELEAVEISRPGSVISTCSTGSVDAHIRRGRASSIVSVESDATVGPDDGSVAPVSTPPVPPPKDKDGSTTNPSGSPQPSDTGAPSTFASTLTNGLTNAMRYMLSTTEVPRPWPGAQTHHGLLLSTDSLGIDERPHIKYDWTVGKRLRFSCTAYFAKQFDTLRRRCGIDDGFLRSLSRSANWAADGGKSRSNFWKTADDRFIIKTLVNAWNVADLQVLIELAPSYFRYMEATASRPTVLAKLIGFYTVEIRNLETGTVQSKADLLVMENLFYEQKIVKTFDLKGIQGRKVKAGPDSSGKISKTYFDGEWIEGQQRTLMLIPLHSKLILREAIKSDAEFLSRSNIMDYSLLLGVDEEQKQIACGLVDTIGSYTFAKTLEYKAKQGLGSGKDTTVVPPAEYQERFVNAMEGYFLACPDKWSCPLDGSRVVSDFKLLPSVL